MSGAQWFQIVQTIVTLIAATASAILYRGVRAGKWIQSVEAYDKRIVELEKRFERAGVKMSQLATEVQNLPERMRDDFVTKEVSEIHLAIYKERHEDLRRTLRDEDTKLWSELRAIKDRH